MCKMKEDVIVVSDIDGTLTPIKSSWLFIHIILNSVYRIKNYIKLYLDDVITYDEWVALELGLWKGIPLSIIEKIIEKIPWRSGIESIVDLVEKYRNKVMFIAISGGLDHLGKRTIKELKFNTYLAVKLHTNNGIITGLTLSYPDYRDKGEILLEFLDINGMDLRKTKVICIGDNINDIGLFKVCNTTIAFCANKNLEKYADIVIRSCNIRILATLLNKILDNILYVKNHVKCETNHINDK
uniref:HAD family hydrolase n=1 Tax=Ignisphaera aggregans TaxID=334771 RepID=A0A7C5TIJ4_9CREN